VSVLKSWGFYESEAPYLKGVVWGSDKLIGSGSTIDDYKIA
jgi:hypothetical protein